LNLRPIFDYHPFMLFLADTTPLAPNSTMVTLDGVTTALTVFIFVCLVLPTMVKHRSQFYAALACVAGIIAVHTLMVMFSFVMFGGIIIGLLQLVGFLLLVLSVGGLTVRELAGDMAKTYEVIRRGETEKEVNIPIGDRPPAAVQQRAAARGKAQEAPRKVYKIDTPDDEDEGIPLS
jgi:hypothetical protein